MAVSPSYALPRVIEIMLQSMLYGAYVVLFGIAMLLLPRKLHIKSVKRFFYPVIIALFVLATINLAYDLAGEGYAVMYGLESGNEKTWMIAGQAIDNLTFTFADILGDSLLLYRVYAIWGFRKLLMIPLVLVLLLAKCFGIITTVSAIWTIMMTEDQFQRWLSGFSLDSNTYFQVTNAVANVSMTALIAGRVWWLSRTIQRQSSSRLELSELSWRVVSTLVESGFIYPTFLVVAAGTRLTNWTCLGSIAIGLAPTLIAVRVGLGTALAYEPTQMPTLPMHFAVAQISGASGFESRSAATASAAPRISPPEASEA